MIRLEKITKKYNERKVLNDLSINFREKEFVAILGPSGCGKSTLLNIISAVEKPDNGELFLGNLSIFKLTKKKQDYYRNNYISYIFQNYNLINYLNVQDNLIISSKLKGKDINKKKINNILDNLGMKNLSKNKVNLLSGGEQQRTAIARSLTSDAKIILADEPTGALDSISSIKIMEILKDLSKERLVIMVTHNEKLAFKYASRIIKIIDGKIINDNKPYHKINNNGYELKKNKLSLLNSILMSFKNIKNKKIRVYLIILAFSLGLISLSLVLAITNGFNKEIKKFEEEVLFNYPLVINKESMSLDNIFNNEETKYEDNIINIHKSDVILTNNIDEVLINRINNIDHHLISGVAYYKDINSKINDYLYVNHNNNYFNLLAGNYQINNNDVLLLLDSNNSINEQLANYLKIKNIKYEEIINQKIMINNKEFNISGVVKSNNNYYQDAFGILYYSDLFEEEIISIEIFPTNYESKIKIKELLKDYNITDDSESVIKIMKNFVNGVSYVLIAFSIISLFVSILMISIVSYISVLERKKEIGILKTLGASSRDIKRLFLSENIIIGLISSIVTIDITFTLGKLINKFIDKKIEINNIVSISNEIIIFTILISLLLSYLAGLIPAKIASKNNVIDILKNE